MAHPHHEHRQTKVEHRRVAHITKHYAHGGAVHSDEAADKTLIKKTVKKTALKVDGHKPKHRADHRARGGRTKGKGGKTNVNVIVAGGHPQQGPMPGPMPAGAPVAPVAPPAARPPMMPPPGGAPGGMPPMPMRAKGGRVKNGPAYDEGLRDGTQVQHAPGKNDGRDLGRGKPITYATGGPVKGKLVQFWTGGKVEAPKGVEKSSKLPGGSGGGEARLAKEHRAKRDYAKA